jgi:phosphoribosyl 1,2-cyclic phosphodiesterase
MQAVEILKRTTTIEGHHPNHDQALQELSKAIESATH